MSDNPDFLDSPSDDDGPAGAPDFEDAPADTNPIGTRSVDVAVGAALPSSATGRLPTLNSTAQGLARRDGDNSGQCLIAEGLNFVGNAQLSGVCSVSGSVTGNLVQAPGQHITIVITETGAVTGDIVATTISVMGHTDGLLDASGGSVTLHDASRVSGHVRYNRLQVNGAELNATLEKAASGESRPAAAVRPQADL